MGCKQMRAHANKCRQALTNGNKHKQRQANTDKRKQRHTLPFIDGLLHPPLQFPYETVPSTKCLCEAICASHPNPPKNHFGKSQSPFWRFEIATFDSLRCCDLFSTGLQVIVECFRGRDRMGWQFSFIFAVLRVLFSCCKMSLFCFKACSPMKGTP